MKIAVPVVKSNPYFEVYPVKSRKFAFLSSLHVEDMNFIKFFQILTQLVLNKLLVLVQLNV